MSDRNEQEKEEVKQWFKERLATMPAVELTEEQYQFGVDSLVGEMATMRDEASRRWLDDRYYELSYTQLSQAFFAAATELGKLQLTPKHPIFRLHTKVIIKEVKTRDRGTLTNVRGTITSVQGDHHLVTFEDDRSLAVKFDTAELDENLLLQ